MEKSKERKNKSVDAKVTKKVVKEIQVEKKNVDNNDELLNLNVENKEIQDIKGLNMLDLLLLEKMCSLVCKRYEMSARLDHENNNKFKEFNAYYEKIFKEMESTVIKMCKKS